MSGVTRSGRGRLVAAAAALFAAVLSAGALAAMVANGDFETGDLTGWTTFTTTDGTVGAAAVASFDTTGNGASNAARFNVGRTAAPTPGPYAGGGISQTVATGGSVDVSADIAAANSSFIGNAACGLFELLVDGAVVASHDFGPCAGSTVVRSTLSATGLSLSAGPHEIRIRITRPYLGGRGTPSEYVDNVILTQLLPKSKDACMKGGWQSFTAFKNQGDCVSYVATGGRNQPAPGS